MTRHLGLVALFISTTTFASPSQDALLDTFEIPQDYPGARARIVHDNALTDAEIVMALSDERWEVRLQAAVVQNWRSNPELAEQRWSSLPGLTRKGTPRFAGEIWRGPDAAPILLERFIQADEDGEVRAALVAGLSHTDGDWTQAVSELFEFETEASVREVMADVLRHGVAEYAWQGLQLAASDSDAKVRAAAMRSIASRKDGAQGEALILQSLSDTDTTARGAAARSAGVLELKSAYAPIRSMLNDSDASVRLHALRALSRIDPVHAAQLTELSQLVTDPDAKVQRLAERIAQP